MTRTELSFLAKVGCLTSTRRMKDGQYRALISVSYSAVMVRMPDISCWANIYHPVEPQPAVSVSCEAAVWKGDPELGFWCYQKPAIPGPSGIQLLKSYFP